MQTVIEWCNYNNGFLTGVLSLITGIISIIAVFVSVRVARLPYRKKMKIGSAANILFQKDFLTGNVESQYDAIVINATNVGNRNINLVYLGLAVKMPREKLKLMYSINVRQNNVGIFEPTKTVCVEYKISEIEKTNELTFDTKVYCFARDSEGTKYKKHCGKVGKMFNDDWEQRRKWCFSVKKAWCWITKNKNVWKVMGNVIQIACSLATVFTLFVGIREIKESVLTRNSTYMPLIKVETIEETLELKWNKKTKSSDGVIKDVKFYVYRWFGKSFVSINSSITERCG